jgi:hypothetical protein
MRSFRRNGIWVDQREQDICIRSVGTVCAWGIKEAHPYLNNVNTVV